MGTKNEEKKYTKESLLSMASSSLRIPFGELDKTNRLDSIKGGVGQMVEESVFGYSINSKSEPDFEELSIELKVVPMSRDKKGLFRAKERVVLNIINYMTEDYYDFYKSHFWKKNQRLLMMFYEHNQSIPKTEWYLDKFCLYEWPEEDLIIIKNDWKTIASKIKNGLAHELSESDTLYLGACTKGSTAEKSYRNQPFSDIPAKQRAYSLKQSYVNSLIRDYLYGSHENEKIIKDTSLLETHSFEEIIRSKFEPYIGRTQASLVEEFNISASKQTNASIIKKILNINVDISKTEEFIKAGYLLKTVRIEKNDRIKESMSFPTFKFKEVANQEWEESDFYNTLAESRFMFIVFQKVDNTDSTSYLKDVIFWSMPEADLDVVKRCFELLRHTINQGVSLVDLKYKITNNLPSETENPISHVRPHASNAYYRAGDLIMGNNPNDGDELPDGRIMTKQCFWLNKGYLRKIIDDSSN